jgi:DNA-binding SARP family transcriptional activator
MTTQFLSIAVLGPLEVRLAGRRVSHFKYNKARALLAYLALDAEQATTRAELCGLLWPELPEKAARRNLSQVLTTLRDSLTPPGTNPALDSWLVLGGEHVYFHPQRPRSVDVTHFLQLLDDAERHPHHSWHTCPSCAQRLQTAMAFYRGEFLAQFYLPDSVPFEDWALMWRERLRQRALSAWERLAARARVVRRLRCRHRTCPPHRRLGHSARR